MGGVSVDTGGGGGRKSVDSNVNMVPMIDLLISVIAFLLMTAVWVQTGMLEASQPSAAGSPEPNPVRPNRFKIVINKDTGYHVGLEQSSLVDVPADNLAHLTDPTFAFDHTGALRTQLIQRHANGGVQENEVYIAPDSDVPYDVIIRVMDAVYDVWGGQASGRGQRSYHDMVIIRFM